MKYTINALSAAYHLNELLSNLRRLSPQEREALVSAVDDPELQIRATEAEGLRRLLLAGHRSKRLPEGFDEFRFETVMERLRHAVMHSTGSEDAAELEWLLKIILESPAVFRSVRELDNFLSNMTGTEHKTKSTGRDRVAEWYFKHINSLPGEERNRVYLKIASNIFAQAKSDYREWKAILYGGGRR